MTIYLTEADVKQLLDMETTIDALDEVFKARARGEAFNSPRSRLPIGRGSYNFMAASWPDKGIVGHKSYVAGPDGAKFHVSVYSTRGGGTPAGHGGEPAGANSDRRRFGAGYPLHGE